MGIFPDAQGQLTHKSMVGSCRISNQFKLLWLSSFPARIKKNQSKMKELEWSQDFPHYNPRGAICCHGNHEFLSDLAQNLMQSIPHPNDAPDEIWLRSSSWSQTYSCLKVWTHGWTQAWTHGGMPAGVPYYKLPLSLRLWWTKNRIWPIDPTPRAGLGAVGIIFASMVLHSWFPLIWYATWPCSVKV